MVMLSPSYQPRAQETDLNSQVSAYTENHLRQIKEPTTKDTTTELLEENKGAGL